MSDLFKAHMLKTAPQLSYCVKYWGVHGLAKGGGWGLCDQIRTDMTLSHVKANGTKSPVCSSAFRPSEMIVFTSVPA